MEIQYLFERLLDLVPPWTVKSVVWEDRADVVDVYVECAGDVQQDCPSCGRSCPVTGFSPQVVWRHVDTCLKKTLVHAGLPVVECPVHGKLQGAVPWAGALCQTLPGKEAVRMTAGFETWVQGLAETFGDAKKASVFAGVDYRFIRGLLRPGRRKAPEAPSAVHGSAESSGQGAKRAQLSLFAQSDMRFLNQGIRAFENLDLEEAVRLFEKHRAHYPNSIDVASKLKAAQFLLEGFRALPAEPGERPGYLRNLWASFEDFSSAEGADTVALASKAKKAFFAAILREVERSGVEGVAVLPENYPAGFVLLQAGKCEEAIVSLQESILKKPESAALYGWLGDAYWIRGELEVARQCYREACYIDPSALDWRHVEDAELKQLKQDILFVYGWDQELAVEWLPGHARIEGLFAPKVVRIHDGLKELVDGYLAVKKQWMREKSPRLSARLFVRGMVVCENAESLELVRKIDLIEVRRLMKQVGPDLFDEFLRTL